MKNIILFILLTVTFHLGAETAKAQKTQHVFSLGTDQFLLDGKPFQVISGEMHPARIPEQYWRQRIKMAKAMGCNTIAAYLFWNFYEPEEGKFDFETGNHNLAEFIKTVQDEGMWLLIRPGPYVCAEWEFGGIPPYLLRIPDIKVRCMDPRYMQAAERYMTHLAKILKPFLVTNGGPVIMMQIENEYGSYGNDRNYLLRLREVWKQNGIDVPFYTSDGATPYMLEAGTLPGCAVGLDPASSQAQFDLAAKMNPGVPVFSSETYPGWLTHWGEDWASTDTTRLLKQIRFLMDNKKSFNFYVIHGGTNFGYTAGANSGGKGYQPDVTSYDYDAPIDEQGRPTAKYFAIRRVLQSYLPKRKKLPSVPAPIPAVSFPQVQMTPFTSVWDNLPEPVASVQPKPFEAYGQDYGFILYKTKLIGRKSGNLVVTDLHDYATVFLNGKYIGALDRREGKMDITLPKSDEPFPTLEILVEGMGRINFAAQMIDRKGITERVTLNGMTLMNWEVYGLPMKDTYIEKLQPDNEHAEKPGQFFKGTFTLNSPADTYIDLSNYQKGLVWVNGHNLGRYWDIGRNTGFIARQIFSNKATTKLSYLTCSKPNQKR